MKPSQLTVILLALLTVFLVSQGAFAQESTIDGIDDSYAQAIADVEANRDAIISSIIGKYQAEMDANEDYVGWDAEIAAALESAPADKVLAATKAGSYAEAVATLFGAWSGPDVATVEDGQSPEDILALGDSTSDLVFFPLTPCRIIDTRFGSFPFRIGPDSGRQFQVNLSNFSSQGGFGGSCGIPTSLEPAAVVINVASTSQLGTGNVSVINTGGGIPNVALVNFTPGVNLSNAAVVRSATAVGNDIFIYARNSATHVVVDLMGYFAAPLRTPLDNDVRNASQSVINGASFSLFSPACISGFRLTGGGFLESQFDEGFNFVGARPVQGASSAVVSGTNVADRYLCQGRNQSGGTRTAFCFSVCARVPGR